MDLNLKTRFLERWQKFFPSAELPVALWYSDSVAPALIAPPAKGRRCIIGDLAKVRGGTSMAFGVDAVPCGGGQRYLGFAAGLRPGFEHFLSCGIPGQMEGERYKKSPEIVKQMLQSGKPFKAPAKYLVCKRWDTLESGDQPEVVAFFATADVLSGLFTLSGFDEVDGNTVIAPFGAGCSSIVQHPFHELHSEHPRAVLGMFDVSARPFVPADTLSFSVPWSKMERMIGNMDESFLITHSWEIVRKRIAKHASAPS